MPIPPFELACVVIIGLTLVAMARRTPWRSLGSDYALLALAGWIGEETCIRIYGFYAYADAWDARVIDVPLLVPLIWPLVILSAREVVRGLFPNVPGIARASLVGGAVMLDASLVEVIAVRAELWSWIEGGHLGVPLIGIAGWGFFAGAADLVLERTKGARRASVVVLAPLIGHALIVASWWAFFRWIGRGELGARSFVGLALVSLAISLAVARARARGAGVALNVAGPRIFAALLFLIVLLTVAPTDASIWLHVALVAIPYLIATRWTLT